MELTPGRAPFEDEDYTPLRKPKAANNIPPVMNSGGFSIAGVRGGGFNSSAGPNAYARTVSPSKLSPYAKEFVPRFGGNNAVQERMEQQQRQYNQQQYQQYQQPQRMRNGYQHHQQHTQQHHQQQQHHSQQHSYSSQMGSLTSSVQDRLKVSGQNKNNSNYYQNKHNNKSHHQNHNNHRYNQHSASTSAAATGGHSTGGGAEVETIALDYLQTVIQCLNQNPGQFDTVATRFLTIFDGMENNQYVLSNAMEDIFQESIQNSNFRYMGAKLYNLLHMLNLKKDSLFHTLLKCKLDYHQQEVIQYMNSGQQHKVRETALFLAELYMQLRGDDSRIHLIAENIVFSLKQLLCKESSDNVRCICLTLKLAGYDLTADCPDDMKQIIIQLDAINVSNPGKYPLAGNVISLQKNNWGRKISCSSSSISEAETIKPVEPLRSSDEPIFYGPDGRELTAEESDFLTGGASAPASTDEDDLLLDGDIDLDPEMDEDAEKAYKEFCKQNSMS